MVVRPEHMPTDTDNLVQRPSPNWSDTHIMIMIRSAERQDVRIVYDLNSKLMCLGPRYLVSRLRGLVLAIERKLTVLGDDVTHGRRPSSRFHAVNYNPSDHKLAQKWLTSGLMVECQGEAGGCGYQKNCAAIITPMRK